MKPSILICDDEKGVRESLRLILAEKFELTFAENGLHALEYLKDNQPKLMLLDIKMPKIHGLEILKEIKKLQPKLPVIIVTGYHSAEVAQEAVKNGAYDYVPKPFSSESILKAVSRAAGN